MLLTRAPVAGGSIATPPLPLDLHVLSLSLAFILSQDQTLRCCLSFLFLFYFINRAGKQERPSVLFFILPSQKQRRILSDLFGWTPDFFSEIWQSSLLNYDSCTTSLLLQLFQCSLRRFLRKRLSWRLSENFAKVRLIFETCKSFQDFNICLTFHRRTIQCLSAFQPLAPHRCEVCFSKASAKVDTFCITSKFFMVF